MTSFRRLDMTRYTQYKRNKKNQYSNNTKCTTTSIYCEINTSACQNLALQDERLWRCYTTHDKQLCNM